jgi:ABC-2 type transport system permease protein
MKKMLLVLKNEFISVVSRKSFLLTLFLIPLTSFVIVVAISGLQQKGGVDTGAALENIFNPQAKPALEGFVDMSGLMQEVPPGYEHLLAPYQTESEASEAIQKGVITAYYLIPRDYVATGELVYVRPDFNPLGGSNQSSSIHAMVAYNLADQSLDLAYRLQDPLNVTEINLSGSQRDETNWLTFFMPYGITFLFYIVILTSSSLMLNSVTNEKTNRVIEILLTSITPQQMLTGKIIALGLVGLLQTVVWLGAGMLLLKISGNTFPLAAAIQLPGITLLWGIIFFLLGYAVYASLMAGIGALVPNLREGSQLTTVVIIPMIVPLILISTLLNTPDSPLAVFLSLFPFTSPVTMMMRIAATSVPTWQVGLAILLLTGTAWLLVRASSGLFRAQNLLAGQSTNIVSFIKALAGR